MLEDMENDLSDAVYQSLETAIKAWDFPRIADAVLNEHSYPINFDDEFTALIYQLIANEIFYKEMKASFSVTLQEKTLSAVETILSKSEDWYKNGLSAGEVEEAWELFDNNLQLLEVLDPESEEFFQIWLDTSDACMQYYDSSKRIEIVNEISETLDLPLSVFSNGLKELETIEEVFQYITYASAYKEVSDEFKLVLEGIAALAKDKATSLKRTNSKTAYDPFGTVQIYNSIYATITNWVEDMDEYQKDAAAEISSKIMGGTAVNASDLTLDFAVDHVLPGFGEIKVALSLGKMGIEVFTTIDDEYKQAIMVTLCKHFSILLIELSEKYGITLVANNQYYNSYEDADSLLFAVQDPYELAQLFDESIKMYKNVVLLACEYGEAYEQTKLDSANEYGSMMINDAKQASLASITINSIYLLRANINKIICHHPPM